MPTESHGWASAVRLLSTVCLGVAGFASAHATLVFGTVTTEPSPPRAEALFELVLDLRDPVGAPVEDAVVVLEAMRDGEVRVAADALEETSPGRYRSELVLEEEGTWTLAFRDRTFRQEEARASITLEVGPEAQGDEVSFIFPPTATGTRSLSTWLLWLVGLPLLAGVVVTVLVLRGGGEDAPGEDADAG